MIPTFSSSQLYLPTTSPIFLLCIPTTSSQPLLCSQLSSVLSINANNCYIGSTLSSIGLRAAISAMSYGKVVVFIRLTVTVQLIIQKMGCIDSQPNLVHTAHTTRARTPKSARSSYKKPVRLITSYTMEEVRQITDEERKAGFKPVYTCPICTLRFNRILACEECNNCICLACYLTYENKAKRNFKCSFCGSETSLFRDYDKEAHSYFDTTGNGGFLTPDERKKVDEQIASKSAQKQKAGSVLEPIAEVDAS